MNHRFLVPTLRVLIWLLPIGVVVWILILNLVPSGFLTLTYHQGQRRDYLSRFDNPDQFGPLYSEQNATWRPVLTERPSFTVYPWRPFREIELGISVLRPKTRIDLTAVGQPAVGSQTKTIFLPEAEEYRDWDIRQEGELLLFQRRRTFSSIDDLLRQPPPESEVSTFGVELGSTIDVEPSRLTEPRTLDIPFRGTMLLGINVTKENPAIRLTVRKFDLNEKIGPDRLTAFVYDRDHVVRFAQTIADDGDETESRQSRTSQSLDIDLTDLPPGEYTVELAANEEVIIESIASRNLLMEGKAPIRPNASADHPVALTVRGQLITIQNKSDAEAAVEVNGQRQVVPPQSRIRLLNPTVENSVRVFSSSLVLRSDGGFVLDGFVVYREQYGFPVLPRNDADRLGINYLIARYVLPDLENSNAFRLKSSFRTSDLLFVENGYRFFLETEAQTDPPNAIGEVALTFADEPLTVRGALRLLRSWASSAIAAYR